MKKVYIYTFAGNFGHTLMKIVQYKEDGTLDWGKAETKGTSGYKKTIKQYEDWGYEVEFKDRKETKKVNLGLMSYSSKMDSLR